MSFLYALQNLLGDGWVFFYEGAVHCDDAAWFIREVFVQQGADTFELAVFYHVVCKGIGQQSSGDFTVFHRSNASIGADLHQVDVSLWVDAVCIQQQAGDVVVGSANAVWNRDGGAFQVCGGVVLTVSQNIQRFAADVCAANEGQVNTVGGRNQHGCDVTNGYVCLLSTQCLGVGGALESFRGQTSFFIVSQDVCNGRTGGAAVCKIELDWFAVSRFFFHSSLLFSGRSQIADFLCASFDGNWSKHLVPLTGGRSFKRVDVFTFIGDFKGLVGNRGGLFLLFFCLLFCFFLFCFFSFFLGLCSGSLCLCRSAFTVAASSKGSDHHSCQQDAEQFFCFH